MSRSRRTGTLTARQVEVLQLAAGGLSVAEIGAAMYLTRDTAKRHLENAYAKLGARNGTHAVALAIGAGLVTPPDPTADMLAA